jgi:hypothetical protein
MPLQEISYWPPCSTQYESYTSSELLESHVISVAPLPTKGYGLLLYLNCTYAVHAGSLRPNLSLPGLGVLTLLLKEERHPMEIMGSHSNLRTRPIKFPGSHPTMSPGLVLIYTLSRLGIKPYNNPDDGDAIGF